MSQNKAKQSSSKETEPTNSDILDAINQFATHVELRFQGIDERFQGVDLRFQSIDERFQSIDERFQSIDERFQHMDERFDKIESTMVTKDGLKQILQNYPTKTELKDSLAAMETRLVTKSYLDDKLLDLKGDLIVIARKEDRKVDNVIGLLQKKNIFSAQEVAELFNPPVFAKTV